MRLRTRYDDLKFKGSNPLQVLTQHWTGLGWDTGDLSSDPFPNAPVEFGAATIEDSPSRGRLTKVVNHSKRKVKHLDTATLTTYNFDTTTGVPTTNKITRTGAYAVHSNYGWQLDGANYPDFRNVIPSYSVTDSALIRRAVHNFMNDNQVDNLTNILQGAQTVDLFRSVRDNLKNLVWHGPGAFLKKRNGALLRTLLRKHKGLSSGYLAYQYGIVPLVSDLKKMATAMLDIKSQVESAVKRPSLRSYYATANGTINPNNDGLVYYGDPQGVDGSYFHFQAQAQECRKIATVRGRNQIQYSSQAFSKLDYLGRRFLSAGPASALWELIPYSFVVDWFAETSSVLEYLDNVLTGASRNIVDVSLSEKLVVNCGCFVHSPPGQYSSAAGTAMGEVALSYYHREPRTADLSIGLSGRFGKKQVSILLALLHQSMANLR
jgi:hypothetical protein